VGEARAQCAGGEAGAAHLLLRLQLREDLLRLLLQAGEGLRLLLGRRGLLLRLELLAQELLQLRLLLRLLLRLQLRLLLRRLELQEVVQLRLLLLRARLLLLRLRLRVRPHARQDGRRQQPARRLAEDGGGQLGRGGSSP